MYNIVHTYINLFPTVKGSRYISVTLPTGSNIATIREMKQQNKMSLHDKYISTQTRSSPIYMDCQDSLPEICSALVQRSCPSLGRIPSSASIWVLPPQGIFKGPDSVALS